MPRLLYIHGFNSSENAQKARLLKQYCEQLGLAGSFISPRLHWQPALAIKQLETIIEANLSQGISLLGSSLGGFYANFLAHKYDIKCMLINPAVTAPTLIKAHLGLQTNYHTGESYQLTEGHIAQLASLDIPLTKPELFWLMLQKGDETLNYHLALDYYKGVKTNLEEGGSHTFDGFERYLDDILQFAQLETPSHL